MSKSRCSVGLTLLCLLIAFTPVSARGSLSFDERVRAQIAIERVYWSHRIWPPQNLAPKPDLSVVMPELEIQAKVKDYLAQSSALEKWGRPITARQLQTELDRMIRETSDVRMLQELFDALDNDPVLIAETLARPALSDRLVGDAWWLNEGRTSGTDIDAPVASYTVPALPETSCTPDSWASTGASAASARSWHTAVWTGTEMIVWGGEGTGQGGGRYVPATGTWTATSTTAGVPSARSYFTAVWTGTEMIVWGGFNGTTYLGNGGRYNPASNSWTAMSTGANLPTARGFPEAVWTGTEMIIWGGVAEGGSPVVYLNTGGRYDPASDSWRPTSLGANVPVGRVSHTALWTGEEMIVWGGSYIETPNSISHYLNTGGRYNPATDEWAPISMSGAPEGRNNHIAIWTGNQMVVWGGSTDLAFLNTGGRYDPGSDSWIPTSTGASVPEPRGGSVAVWTGSHMLVWGGFKNGIPSYVSTGGRYDPSADSWSPTSGINAPVPRVFHSAVWTGKEMIVWGGRDSAGGYMSSGGAYCMCPEGRIVYRDADGDGQGDVRIAAPTCDGELPSGYSAAAGDCNDANASMYLGAPETCDGQDNDCNEVVDDGVPPPGGSNSLGVAKNGVEITVAWPPLAGATVYDVVEGDLALLAATIGDFQLATTGCVADDLAATTFTVASPPTPGAGSWILIRGSNCGGAGSYDEIVGNQVADRDAAINGSAAACP